MLGLLKKTMVTFEVVLIVLFIMEFSVIYGDKSKQVWFSGLSSR